MKVFSGFILLNSVLAGPTPPPVTECPTDCEEVIKMGLMKGARPDCDIEELYETCMQEKGNRPDQTTVTTTTEEPKELNFPEYLYSFPEARDPAMSDMELGRKHKICTVYENVCCPLMVGEQVAKSAFNKKTLLLLDDPMAQEMCKAANNFPCCVTGDLCAVYPDLPHCDEKQPYEDYGLPSDDLDDETTASPEIDPTTLAPTEEPVEELIPVLVPEITAAPVTHKITTEAPTEEPVEELIPVPELTTEAPAAEVPTTIAPLVEENTPEKMAIVSGDNRNGEEDNINVSDDNSGEEEGENAKSATTRWWIVLALLGGVAFVVLTVVLGKKLYANRGASGYAAGAEVNLIAEQQNPAENVSVDMPEDEQSTTQQQQQS